ncbi:MAG TPA: GIY-YIG nuclease family protein [Caulobacteraceae bacterium]|nr:GIY-YIG nuclease family protein [Caulobacteraceae bacterium]
MADLSDEEMLAELGVAVEVRPARAHTAREERVIAGFEDIVRFCEKNGRPPCHGEDRDIFERLYAVRLDRLRALPEFNALLAPLDIHGLLRGDFPEPPASGRDGVEEDEAMLAELDVASAASITKLRHVRPYEEKRAAEEIANRAPCKDFKAFKPLFERADEELTSGVRATRRFGENAEIKHGEFFVLGGQLAYVAEVGEEIRAPNGERDARLRVIFANGTESNLLRRSLQRALYKDEAGRRVTDAAAGPLFADEPEEGDAESGTIYVLRSLSDHPEITGKRDLIHKIGVTKSSVESRIAAAADASTYLLAAVEVVATYKLYNINRVKLERLLHDFFAPARLDLTIEDRFGKPVKPREWYLVPLPAIEEAVQRIRDGSILDYAYDPETASLRRIAPTRGGARE